MESDHRNVGASQIQKRAEDGGLAAWTSGLARDENPYASPAAKPFVDPHNAEIARLLAEAWWRGWDRASALSLPGVPDR